MITKQDIEEYIKLVQEQYKAEVKELLFTISIFNDEGKTVSIVEEWHLHKITDTAIILYDPEDNEQGDIDFENKTTSAMYPFELIEELLIYA